MDGLLSLPPSSESPVTYLSHGCPELTLEVICLHLDAHGCRDQEGGEPGQMDVWGRRRQRKENNRIHLKRGSISAGLREEAEGQGEHWLSHWQGESRAFGSRNLGGEENPGQWILCVGKAVPRDA